MRLGSWSTTLHQAATRPPRSMLGAFSWRYAPAARRLTESLCAAAGAAGLSRGGGKRVCAGRPPVLGRVGPAAGECLLVVRRVDVFCATSLLPLNSMQAKWSSIDFNYLGYAKLRWAEYRRRKAEFLRAAPGSLSAA